MVRKDANKKRLDRLLRNPDTPPDQLKKTFEKHFNDTRDFRKRQLYRKEISKDEYDEHIDILDAIEFRVKLMITKITRLKTLLHSIDLSKKESEEYKNEIKILKTVNTRMYDAIKDIVEFCSENNNLGEFKVIIFFFIIFQKLTSSLILLDLNELNKLFENNGIQIIHPHNRYSNFEEALKSSEENANKIIVYDPLSSNAGESNALLYYDNGEVNMDEI
ncbi:32431_t:CDS:2 [Gigaspora margarita]|uniref:32431_t:CDS:1 n=1 Tax=Gigaspora margarita TaxID=4874 RepID=A0ABN7UPW5_GIGMA|nr:32431_t:CDS:2 [Gigaspora margarita]